MFDFLNKNRQLFIFKIVYKKSVKLSNLRDLLEGIDWTYIISGSTVITSGKANAMLPALSNIVFCRYIHQITACFSYIKRVDTYEKYVSLSTEYPFYQRLCDRKG